MVVLRYSRHEIKNMTYFSPPPSRMLLRIMMAALPQGKSIFCPTPWFNDRYDCWCHLNCAIYFFQIVEVLTLIWIRKRQKLKFPSHFTSSNSQTTEQPSPSRRTFWAVFKYKIIFFKRVRIWKVAVFIVVFHSLKKNIIESTLTYIFIVELFYIICIFI